MWQAEPDKAKGKPSVTVTSEAASSGAGSVAAGPFSWRVDLPPALGGTNAAPSPTALLLSALAGCAVVFIRDTLAPQLGVRVESVTSVAQCEADSRGLLGMDGVAPDLQNLQVTITIQSPDPVAKVQAVYAAWEERCPIYLALQKGLAVQTKVDIKS